MNKKLLSVLFIGAFLLSTMGTLTSCSKDYDDDINDLKSQLALKADKTDLTSQIAALQTALTSAQSQLATQIAAKADAATVTALAGRVSTLESQLATANSTLANLQTLINAKVDKTTYDAKVAAIEAEIASLNGDLSGKITSEENARIAADAQLQTQLDALNRFKARIDSLVKTAGISGDNAVVEYLKAAYEKANTAADWINTNKSLPDDVASVTSDLAAYKLQMQQKLQALEDMIDANTSELSALTLFVNKMLTSITLMPDYYINGIEAILFKSISYIPVVAGTSGNTYVTNANPIYVDNGTTSVNYRLNPSSVQMAGIDSANVSFTALKATELYSTRAEVASPIAVNGFKLVNGVMTVNCKKTTNTSLNIWDEDNEMGASIYTVALKVPRVNSDGTKVNVYSEYARVNEMSVRPHITPLPYSATVNANHFFPDSTTIYQSDIDNNEYVYKEVVYNQSYDLDSLVTGCYYSYNDEHNQITKAELKTYGLEFRYQIASAAYTNVDNSTDQQQFASIKGSMISSKLPNGVTNNKAAIGKEPIVLVTLYDAVNHKIVDQKYLKIKWVAKVVPPVTLTDKVIELELPCEMAEAELTWKDFIDEVYAKIGENGISHSQFYNMYNIDVTSEGNWFVAGYANWSENAGDANVAYFGIPAQAIGTIDQAVGYKDMVINVKMTPNGTWTGGSMEDYPVINWKITFRVKLPTTLASIHGYYDNYWYNKYDIVDVYPVQYNTDAQTVNYVRYYNNMMNPFTFNTSGLIIDNLGATAGNCRAWDLQFAKDQPVSGFTTSYSMAEPYTPANASAVGFAGYYLIGGGTQAAQLVWDDTHTTWTQKGDKTTLLVEPKSGSAYQANWPLINPLSDEKEANGITPKVLSHDNKITFKVWERLNAYNYYCVKQYNVCLIAPLKIDAALDGYFEEGLSSGSVVDCSSAFTLTDFRGYKVVADGTGIASPADTNTYTAPATGATEYNKYHQPLYNYYGVQAPVWDLSNIVVGMKVVNGSIVVDDTVTPEQAAAHMLNNTKGAGLTFAEIASITNGNIKLSVSQPTATTLMFKNNGGNNVEFNCNLFINTSVQYAFGRLIKTVTIPLYKAGNAPAKN